MRATRARRRRRRPRTRTRAERLAHLQPTNRQDHLPEMGQQLASQANRDGVVARCSDPAVPQRVAVARARMGGDDQWLSDVELSIVQTAQQPEAPTVSRRPSIPGIGKLVRGVRLDDIHAMSRFPWVQDVVSDGRLVTCAQDSAGKRDGTSGAKLGQADLTWAFAAAAVRFLRHHPVGPTSLRRLEKKPGQGNA